MRKTTREIYEETTGKPWATAKAQGLTTGTYEDNMKLRSKLLYNKPLTNEVSVEESPEDIQNKKDAEINARVNKILETKYANDLKNLSTLDEEAQGELMDKIILDKAAETILQSKPQGNKTREEYLDSLEADEEELLKASKPIYRQTGLNNIRNAFNQNHDKDTSFLGTNREREEEQREAKESPFWHQTKDFGATVGAMFDQLGRFSTAALHDDYSLEDALEGKQRDISITEEIATDPLTYIGGLGALRAGKTLVKAGSIIAAKKALKPALLKAAPIALPLIAAPIADKYTKMKSGHFKDFYSSTFKHDNTGNIIGLQ